VHPSKLEVGMANRVWRLAGVILVSAFVVCGARADEAQEHRDGAQGVERQLGADRFVAGGSLSVSKPVAGDLIAAGGNVDVDAAVAGDAIVAGGNLRLGGDVGQSVYAAAGQLRILGKVGRNVRVAGGQIEIGPNAQIAGNLTSGGGQVNLNGGVTGYVQVAGGRVVINGPVGGDVEAASGRLELGPNARIAGSLRYRSADEFKRDPAAQVSGGVERLAMPVGVATRMQRERSALHGGASVAWTLGMMLLAAVLLAALPGFYEQVAQTLRTRPGISLLAGFALLVCTPVAAVILLVTVIGVPLGLLTIALYLALLPVAYVSAAIALGAWALSRWRADSASRIGWRIGAALLALLLIALLGAIPWLGSLVGFAALLAGLGALLLQLQRQPSGR
jgi:cytoskeletal protein CcmA (bactofilin family)